MRAGRHHHRRQAYDARARSSRPGAKDRSRSVPARPADCLRAPRMQRPAPASSTAASSTPTAAPRIRARAAATGASIRARPATRPSRAASRARARRRTATTAWRARRTSAAAATAPRSASTSRSTSAPASRRVLPGGQQHDGDDNRTCDCSPTCGDGIVEPARPATPASRPAWRGPARPIADRAAACETAMLVSAGTCSAVCVRYPVSSRRPASCDGCCPPGRPTRPTATARPLCGNGVVDDGEVCDVGIPPLSPGSCPTSCDDDNPCTPTSSRTGCQVACQHDPDHGPGLRRRLLPAGKRPESGHRLPGRVRQRHPRTRRGLRRTRRRATARRAARRPPAVAPSRLPARGAGGRRG